MLCKGWGNGSGGRSRNGVRESPRKIVLVAASVSFLFLCHVCLLLLTVHADAAMSE